jgi:hypothetical protein
MVRKADLELERVLAPVEREQLRLADLEAARDLEVERVKDSDLVVAQVRAEVLEVAPDLVKVLAAESARAERVPVERALVESEPVLVGRVSEDRELGLGAEDFWELGRARVRVLAQARVRDLVRGRAGELAKGPSTFPRSKNRTFRDC